MDKAKFVKPTGADLSEQIKKAKRKKSYAKFERELTKMFPGTAKSKSQSSTEKTLPKAMTGLMNWPPSRGPQPSWMRAKPRYVVPKPRVQMLPAKGPKPRIERVVTRPTKAELRAWELQYRRWSRPGKRLSKARCVGNWRTLPRFIRRFDYWVNAHVATLASIDVAAADSLVQGKLTNVRVRKPVMVGGKMQRDAKGRPRSRVAREDVLSSVLPDRPLTVDLHYPLGRVARVTIEPYHTVRSRSGPEWRTSRPLMSVGYFLWQLAKVYTRIYRSHRRWGVWGHAIEDLVFETIRVRDNVVEVSVGS